MKVAAPEISKRLERAKKEANELKFHLTEAQKKYQHKVERIKILEQELAKLKYTDGIRVSDHALVRYLERVEGVDFTAVKQKIVNENLMNVVNTLGGNGKFPQDGYTVVMQKNIIVTITD